MTRNQRFLASGKLRWLVCGLVLILASGGALLLATTARHAPSARAASRGVLFNPNLSVYPNEDGEYPRVIRLTHSGSSNGTVLATFVHMGNGSPRSFPIYQSTDDGQTWSTSPIATITDTQHPTWGLDSPTLFEFPQTLGSYSAGTLLAGATAWINGDNSHIALEIYVSTDHGSHWSYLSNCAQEDNAGHGIYEPDFQIDSAGNLACYFSDERQSGYNQLLGHVVSTNGGVTWGSEVYDVAVQDGVQRPGMATVIRLPTGQYMMSYEDCGNQNCAVYVKTSSNGDDWSPANSLGTLVQTSDGRHFIHTPYLAWSPAGGPNGELLLSGQRLVTGSELPESGRTVLVNTNLGVGSWNEIPAPFVISPTGGYGGGETPCPGYSSPILPSTTGTNFLYMAGVGISNKGCQIQFGTASSALLPYTDSLADGNDAGWTTYGGSWSVSGGVYRDSNSGPGNKSVTGSTGWGDYTLQGDVKLNASGQAGLIARVSAPGTGSDALQGYYVGIETGGTVFLGRQNNNWTQLQSTALAGGVTTNTWYHLIVQAVGCTFTISAFPVGSSTTTTTFSYTDTGCSFTSGQVGVRDHYTTASWRNISVSGSFPTIGSGWTPCAGENQNCSFSGTAAVAYGAAGQFAYGTFTNGVSCSNGVFDDPDAGVVKSCFVSTSFVPPAPGVWTQCASENGTCSFAGTKQVAYGNSGHYAYGTFTNGTACTNSVFSPDPDPGVVKACLTAPVSTSSSTPTPTPTPTNTPVSTPPATNTPPATSTPIPTNTPGSSSSPGLVVNGGFETGDLTGWTCDAGTTVVSSPVHSGNDALQLNPTSSLTGQCTQTISVQANHAYTLSAYVQGNYAYLGVTGGASTWTNSTSYTQLTVPFTTGASQTSITIYVHGWYAQGTVYVDDVIVQ
jgi:Domain of Unknown Function (DUF1080)/Carbohydrate binding domain